MKLTRSHFHKQVYFYTLGFVALSLPLSVYFTSVFQILLLVNWLAEGEFRMKWQRFRSDRALWILLSFYLIHLVGLLWSDDLVYGLKDIRIKLPLFVLPLIVATSPSLTKTQTNRILLMFTAGVFIASMASVMKLLGLLPGEVQGYRDLSLFMSHIRFSLMIVLALLVSVWFIFIMRNTISPAERMFYMVCLIWLPVFLVLLKSLSGIFIAAFLVFFFMIRGVMEIRDPVIRFMVLVPVIMLPVFSIMYLGHSVNKFYSFEPLEVSGLDKYTREGNKYLHKKNPREVENGHYIWVYVCDRELEREWNKVSEIDYRGKTHNGNSIRGTLIRFLTSKGLRKDAAGFSRLTSEEIRAVERGLANYIYLQRFRLYPRIYEVIWEIDRYRMGYSPNDKSVVQRFLYLEAGWKIARENLFIGVGTGDVKQAFKSYYEQTGSPLREKWRRRAHNQYLTFLIAFGIPGALLCLFTLVAPLMLSGRNRSFMATGFLILIMLSMLNEDTLETATGVAFTAYFYTLFLFGPDFPWLRRNLLSKNDRQPARRSAYG